MPVDYGSAISDLLLKRGQAEAQGNLLGGQIVGGTLQNIGNTIAEVPLRNAQLAEAEQRREMGAMQIQQAKAQQAAQQLFGQGIASSIKPDGSIDLTDFSQAAKNNPGLAAMYPQFLEAADKANTSTLKLRDLKRQSDQAEADQMADIVAASRKLTDPTDQAEAFVKLLQHGVAAGTIDRQHAQDAVTGILDENGQPDPARISQTFDAAEALSSAARTSRAELQKPEKLGEGESLIIPATGQVVAKGSPKTAKTQAELAADAATLGTPQETPTAKASKAAVDLLQAPTVANTARATQSAEETARHNRAMEALSRARTAQSGTDTAADAKAIADAIASGDQPPSVTGLYRFAGPVRAELARQGYDFTKANLDWEATKKHLSTLNGAQQTRLRQAISTASDSLGVIEDLAKKWDGGKFPILNKANLALAKNGALGPQAQQIATNLTAQITDVTSELGNVYMGGNSPTDHALSLAQQNLSADWTRDQLLSAIKLARTNLQIRNNSILNSGAITTSGAQAPPAAPAATPPPAASGGIPSYQDYLNSRGGK